MYGPLLTDCLEVACPRRSKTIVHMQASRFALHIRSQNRLPSGYPANPALRQTPD